VGRWQRDHPDRLTVALVSRGSVDANKSKTEEHGLSNVLLQSDREVARTYQGAGTPSGIIVTPDGKIGSPIAQGSEAIRKLVARTMGTPNVPVAPPQNGNGLSAKPLGPTVGDSAPEISLPDIDGKTVRLADFSDQETLVLFWNPGCGFCSRMLPDLQTWIANRGEGEPALLVVSRGDAEENRKQGIEAPILLDQGFAAGRSFGATGTPAAVLISESGMIASPVVAGANAVLTLARGGVPQDQVKPSS
jgi:peroxiredoxin